MTKVSLIANKAMTYATRRLQAGDEFLASERDATILTYAKKAKRKRTPGHIAPPPASVVAKVAPEEPVEPVLEPVVETVDEPAVEATSEAPAEPEKRATRRRRKPRGE